MRIWPLATTDRILPDEYGQFGSARWHNTNTGVGLYCQPGTKVVAMMPGTGVKIAPFTGIRASSPWLNNTVSVVLHEHESGKFVVYAALGTQTIQVEVGVVVGQGTVLGVVDTPALNAFFGCPMYKLRLEMYKEQPTEPLSWVAVSDMPGPKPSIVEDPTGLLAPLATSTFDLRYYRGTFAVDVNAPRKPSPWWCIWGGRP